MPKNVAEFSRATLTNPIIIRLDSDIKISPNLQLSYVYARHDDKLPVLLLLCSKLVKSDSSILIFAATRYHVELLSHFLRSHHIKCVHCYGSMEQDFRKANVERFRRKRVNVMIVTDVAARGIDIPLLDFVINFQVPTTPKTFVHRVGRVARNGQMGVAINIIEHEELPYVADIYRFLGHRLPTDAETRSFNDCPANRSIIDDEFELRDSDNGDEEEEEEQSKGEMDGNGGGDIDSDAMDEHESDNDNNFVIDESIWNDEDGEILTFKKRKKKCELIFNDKVSFGLIPTNVLLPFTSIVSDQLGKDEELTKLLRAAQRSVQKYNATKIKATKSGTANAKLFDCHLVHPLFANNLSSNQSATQKMLTEIARFKANTTVFEMGGARNPNYEMMQRQRFQRDAKNFSNDKNLSVRKKEIEKQTLKNVANKRTNCFDADLLNKYRDKQFFIETNTKQMTEDKFAEDMFMVNSSTNQSDKLRQFVMELDDDERAIVDTKKKLYRYNNNTRKYATEFMGDRINRLMTERNESAAKINGNKHKYGKLYEKWKEKSKREVPLNGSMEKGESIKLSASQAKNIRNLGLRSRRNMKGSKEDLAQQRASEKLAALRKEQIEKIKKRKEAIKKAKKQRFRLWWEKNGAAVKHRKSLRRNRPF